MASFTTKGHEDACGQGLLPESMLMSEGHAELATPLAGPGRAGSATDWSLRYGQLLS